MRQRIWELDALRGLCVLGMVAVHLLYDFNTLLQLQLPRAYDLALNWGGILFLLLSGISVTLGSHHIRRGLTVFLCGMLCTAVTAGLYYWNLAGKGIIIYFGVLHCLGVCMVLWSLFRRLPAWGLATAGIAAAAAGLYLDVHTVYGPSWLLPFGILYPGFSSADYFPLLPNLGFFVLGCALGRTLYRKKGSLFPNTDHRLQPARFLCACGRCSLPIYLLHQPVISLLLVLLSFAA